MLKELHKHGSGNVSLGIYRSSWPVASLHQVIR